MKNLLLVSLFLSLFIGMGYSQSFPKATIVTKVMPEGEKVVAIVLEYDTEINGWLLNSGMFNVEAKVNDEVIKRNITKVYASNTGDINFNAFSNQGRFVILELNPNDYASWTTTFDLQTFLSKRLNLEYKVEQNTSLKGIDGKEINPFVVTTTNEKHLVIDEFKSLTYEDKGLGVSLNYRLYVPKDMRKNKKYPLVVFLHGAGERGKDNYVQLAGNKGAIVWAEPGHQAEHPCFVLAPQCPPESSWTELLTGGNPFNPTKYLRVVANLIKKLISEENIDPNRVYVTGVSMGGFGTFALIMEYSELFAAAIPICGGGDVSKLEKIKNIPIWVFHAEDDSTVSVDFSRVIVRELVELGGKVKYTEIPKGKLEGQGYNPHWSWIPAYESEEVIDWLFEQKK